MAEQPHSRSLRDYASFELERKGYNRAQVDAFLTELDQAFLELETSVKERGNEVAELQVEVERLKRESPVGRGEEILKRVETNAEQMLASSLAEGQEIVAKAEAMAMRIIANARAQSQDLAAQPPGFGMLARVRTEAADIDRIKAEHAAVMEERPELLAPGEKIVTFGDEEPTVVPEAAPAPPKKPAGAKKKSAAKAPQPAKETEEVEGVDEEEPTEAKVPRIKLVEPPTVEKVAAEEVTVEAEAADEVTIEAAEEDTVEAVEEVAAKTPEEVTVEAAEEVTIEAPGEVTVEAAEEVTVEADDDEIMLDPKAFDWGAARQEAIQARGDEVTTEPPESEEEPEEDPEEDPETAAIAAAREKLPTVMRREGSRYERHSASLPRIGSEGESTLSDVSKVSKRRRRRAAYRDDER